jgi:hypothetical protein
MMQIGGKMQTLELFLALNTIAKNATIKAIKSFLAVTAYGTWDFSSSFVVTASPCYSALFQPAGLTEALGFTV